MDVFKDLLEDVLTDSLWISLRLPVSEMKSYRKSYCNMNLIAHFILKHMFKGNPMASAHPKGNDIASVLQRESDCKSHIAKGRLKDVY